MTHPITSSRPALRCRAFSMAETLVSILIVGTLLVAAMNTAGAATLGRKKIGDRGVGLLLARDLVDEILQQDYEDADASSGSFSLDADEVGDGSRALWNDVDDYDGWSASPPEQKDGTVMGEFPGWRRTVSIDWVPASDLNGTSGSDTRIKRIYVTVTYKNVEVAKLVSIRAGPGPALMIDPRKPPVSSL